MLLPESAAIADAHARDKERHVADQRERQARASVSSSIPLLALAPVPVPVPVLLHAPICPRMAVLVGVNQARRAAVSVAAAHTIRGRSAIISKALSIQLCDIGPFFA